jgi:hypothetical protein
MVEVTQAEVDTATAYFNGVQSAPRLERILAGCRLSAYALDKVTPEVKEAVARAMRDCLEVTWHDTHGNDATICKDSIDDAAQSALLAAFAVLRGDDNGTD